MKNDSARGERSRLFTQRVEALASQHPAKYADACSDFGIEPEDEFLAERSVADEVNKKRGEYGLFMRTALRPLPPLENDEIRYSKGFIESRLSSVVPSARLIGYKIPPLSPLSRDESWKLLLEVQAHAREIGLANFPDLLESIEAENVEIYHQDRYHQDKNVR